MFLDKYGTVLLEYGTNFTYVGVPLILSRGIYGTMQLDVMIPNITLVFLQNVTWMPKAGFPNRDPGFSGIL